MTASRQEPACPDTIALQRWRDEGDAHDHAVAIAMHVRDCQACRDRVEAIDEDRRVLAQILEDDATAARDADRAMVEAVRQRLAARVASPKALPLAVTGDLRQAQSRRGTLGHLSSRIAAAVLLVGVGLGIAALLDRRPLLASADSVISESQVRSRSWRSQPGKIRQEIYDSFSQDTGKATVHQRQTNVFSTIPGAEATTTRITDASGALVSATWRRTDGWGATFDTRDGPRLILDPSTADLESMLATLTGEDAEALRFWIKIRLWQVRPQEQAVSQAAVLNGGVAYFMQAMGTMQGPAEFHTEPPGYRIVATVEPHRNNPDKVLARVEDWFSASSLMHERRLITRVTREGVVLGTSGRQLISRGDVSRVVLDRLMADVESPPPHWRVTRTTLAEAVADARRVWRLMKPSSNPQGATPDRSAPPATR